MNYYIVVEGPTEKYVYNRWIPLVNPTLRPAQNVNEIIRNNFYIISGGGYPQYFRVVQGAIEEVNNLENINKLVISVDSEEMSMKEKYDEVNNFVSKFKCKAKIHIIIQHFCIEAWALGNRQNLKKKTFNQKLISYLNYFNVVRNDPELLPPYYPEELTRAQFAKKYLKTIINDRYTVTSYSERNPSIITKSTYFSELISRYEESNHISSFAVFLETFK